MRNSVHGTAYYLHTQPALVLDDWMKYPSPACLILGRCFSVFRAHTRKTHTETCPSPSPSSTSLPTSARTVRRRTKMSYGNLCAYCCTKYVTSIFLRWLGPLMLKRLLCIHDLVPVHSSLDCIQALPLPGHTCVSYTTKDRHRNEHIFCSASRPQPVNTCSRR